MKYMVLISLLIFALAGCGSTPKIEEYANNPDGMWQEGKKLSEKGEKLITRGEKAVEDARTELREGEALIQSGTERILRARQDYQAEALQMGNSSSPEEVEFEAKRLSDIGNRWEDAINDVKKGNSKITKSKNMQTKAQEQIREGRGLVETGSNFIRNSQRIRMKVPLVDAADSKD